MFSDNLPLVLAAWMAVIALLVISRRRKHVAGVGLVLAYVLNLWLIHWVASFLYVLPWHLGGQSQTTVAGTEQSLYAVAAFAFGSLALAPFLVDSGLLPRASGVYDFDPRLPKVYLAAGVFFYVILNTPLGSLPSATAIISSGQQLVAAGVGLCWWQAWKANDRKRMALWLGASFLPPFFTVITRGFIGYGAFATLTILIFISSFSRSRLKLVVVGTLLAYAGLSVYVTYMRDRADIRRSVWGGEELSSRWDRLAETAGSFEWFDISNPAHLDRIDDRLNQSSLVGSAVLRLNETNDYANGSTLYQAVLALIPRALWANKTITAGSGNLVAQYTGIQFDNLTTSVGIGPVLEFYINFGTTGVVVGFIFLGLILTSLDILATERLINGDLGGFLLYYLPGIAFLQVGGQLVEVTAAAAGSIIVVLVVNKYFHRYQRRQVLPPVILPGGADIISLARPTFLPDAQ